MLRTTGPLRKRMSVFGGKAEMTSHQMSSGLEQAHQNNPETSPHADVATQRVDAFCGWTDRPT
jgi:hypothetical protein